MTLATNNLHALRLRFDYAVINRRIPCEAWAIVEQIYYLSGFDYAALTIRGWRES